MMIRDVLKANIIIYHDVTWGEKRFICFHTCKMQMTGDACVRVYVYFLPNYVYCAFPITLASRFYNSLYYRTSRDT